MKRRKFIKSASIGLGLTNWLRSSAYKNKRWLAAYLSWNCNALFTDIPGRCSST